MVSYLCGALGNSSLFKHPIRVFLKDYGTPLTLIFFTGFIHIGRMRNTDLEKLPTGIAFEPTADRSWAVNFWDLSTAHIFLALPFAVLLTILFWFDHNGAFINLSLHQSLPILTLTLLVSSLIAQGSEFPLRKPAGFHWDIFLLGVTTGVAGILGIPFPNGLIPQAPFHTESLCVTKAIKEYDEKGEEKGGHRFEATHVVEQRVSNLAQGLLTLGTMTGPLLVVLHLVPQGVLAGLFFIMGIQALEANGITAKLVFLARDKALTPSNAPLNKIKRRSAIWIFVGIEIFAFVATYAITQTVAAIGFPVFILVLIPIRALILPRVFSSEELSQLDAPTASEFIMEGIGGSYGGKAVDNTVNNNDNDNDEDDFMDDVEAARQHEATMERRRRRSTLSREESYYSHRYREGVFAGAGEPRRSQEDLNELGRVGSGQTTATRRSANRSTEGRSASGGARRESFSHG